MWSTGLFSVALNNQLQAQINLKTNTSQNTHSEHDSQLMPAAQLPTSFWKHFVCKHGVWMKETAASKFKPAEEWMHFMNGCFINQTCTSMILNPTSDQPINQTHNLGEVSETTPILSVYNLQQAFQNVPKGVTKEFMLTYELNESWWMIPSLFVPPSPTPICFRS